MGGALAALTPPPPPSHPGNTLRQLAEATGSCCWVQTLPRGLAGGLAESWIPWVLAGHGNGLLAGLGPPVLLWSWDLPLLEPTRKLPGQLPAFAW